MGAWINRPTSSAEELESIILLAQDGDTIVVASEWEKEIGEELLRLKRPGSKIRFVVTSDAANGANPDSR